MNRRIFGVGLALAFCLASSASAQSLDNRGDTFLITFLTQFAGPQVEVHLTADTATKVTIEHPVNAPTFTQTVDVNPGQVTIVLSMAMIMLTVCGIAVMGYFIRRR